MSATVQVEQLGFIRDAVMASLAACGWKAIDSVAVCSKAIETAVGTKTALAYVQDFGADTKSFMLAGEYTSEGSNALEGCGVLLPKDSSFEAAEKLVGQFAASAEKWIGWTYAVRLLQPSQEEERT